jgi:short-subunit dehydrogenase
VLVKKPEFAGSWALVTGASSGLGAEFARQLAHRGANLVLTARSRERLTRFAEDLSRVNGVASHALVADLAEPGGARALLSQIDALGVHVSHVINNAGFGSTGAFATSDAEAEARMVRLNAESVVSIARHFLPRLLGRNEGGLIQVASTSGFQPTPFMATYGASKAFVLSFTLSLAEEVRGTGVRVTALCPGPVRTGFQEAAGIHPSGLLKLTRLHAPRVVEAALDGYAAGRVLVIPGALNSLQTTAVRFLPRGLVVRAARWTMQGLGRG